MVPASKIYETLHSEDLIEIRKENEQKLLKESVPGMD